MTDVETISLDQKETPFGKNNLIVGATDGYGLCMSIAAQGYLNSVGAKSEVLIEFPKNNPANFWTGIRDSEATVTSKEFQKRLEGKDKVIVVGIPFNNVDPEKCEESLRNSNNLEKTISQGDAGDYRILIANEDYLEDGESSERKTKSVFEVTDVLKIEMSQYEEGIKDGVNLIRIARFVMKDATVLSEVDDPDKVKFYEDLALGVEVSSRASVSWCRENWKAVEKGEMKRSEYYSKHAEESNRKIEETLKKLKERDWEFFEKQGENFREDIDLPTVVVSPQIDGSESKLALIDIEGLPAGFHTLALEEIARESQASFVVGTRYKPLYDDLGNEMVEKGTFDYAVKLVKNWKKKDVSGTPLVSVIESHLENGDRFTGSKRIRTVGTKDSKRAAKLTSDILLDLDPDLNEVFEGVNTIAIIGDPNTGKSSVAEVIERYCNLLSGWDVARRIEEVDRVGYTPDSFMGAYTVLEKAKDNYKKGKINKEELVRAGLRFQEEKIKRESVRLQDWTQNDLDEVRKLIDDLPDGQISLIDMPGGLPERNEKGEIVRIDRSAPQVTYFLESPKIDAVFVLGRDGDEITAWKEIVRKVNQKREDQGFSKLRIVGDAITSVEEERYEVADYPKREPDIHGRLTGIGRGKIYEPNSGLFLLSVFISVLGIKKNLEYV